MTEGGKVADGWMGGVNGEIMLGTDPQSTDAAYKVLGWANVMVGQAFDAA
jgi:hypothetical protein